MHTALVNILVSTRFLVSVVFVHSVNRATPCINFIFRPSATLDMNSSQLVSVAAIVEGAHSATCLSVSLKHRTLSFGNII